jgi:hypothetical protein
MLTVCNLFISIRKVDRVGQCIKKNWSNDSRKNSEYSSILEWC